MINPTESLSAVYRNLTKTTCGVSALRDILYGYVDCCDSLADWRYILSTQLDEPGDFEAFKIFSLDGFWLCLGSPGEPPECPAPWRFAAEMSEVIKRFPDRHQLAWLPKDSEDLSLGYGLAVVGPGLLEFLGIEEE